MSFPLSLNGSVLENMLAHILVNWNDAVEGESDITGEW